LLSNGLQIAGTIGVIVSLFILAWQTRRLTQQTETGNLIAISDLNHNATSLLHSAWRIVAEDSALRPYFYDEKPCPDTDPNRSKALMVAEMAADAASYAVLIADLLPQERHGKLKRRGDWNDTARFIVRQPIVREVINDHQEWWPALLPFVAEADGGVWPGLVRQSSPTTAR
jgi:hypothetical protein